MSSVQSQLPAGDMREGVPPPAAIVDMEPVREEDRGSRSFFQQAIRDTFQQIGARLGGFWIATLATLAILAPLIANSHPILLRRKGGPTEWPMIKNLTAIDWTLLAVG